MNPMLISLNAVLPIFLMIGCGFLAKHFRLLSKDVANQATWLYSYLFLPALLCNNIYQSQLSQAFSLAALLFCLGGLLFEFLVWLLLVPGGRITGFGRVPMVSTLPHTYFRIDFKRPFLGGRLTHVYRKRIIQTHHLDFKKIQGPNRLWKTCGGNFAKG